MSHSKVIYLALIFLITGCTSSSELNISADNNDKAETYYQSIGQPQVADQISREAQGKNRGIALLGAVISGTAGVLQTDGASTKCEQGHVDDRDNCRKRNREQVEALNNSIKKHTDK